MVLQIENMCRTHVFALALVEEPYNLLGVEFLLLYGCITDLTNHLLCVTTTQTMDNQPVIISVCDMVSAVEKPEEYNLDNIAKGKADLQVIVTKHIGAFAKHNHECVRIVVTIVITGNFPTQKQYSFPDKARHNIASTIIYLLQQGVIQKCTSEIPQLSQCKNTMSHGTLLLIIKE